MCPTRVPSAPPECTQVPLLNARMCPPQSARMCPTRVPSAPPEYTQVPLFAHQEHRAHGLGGGVQAPAHLQRVGKRRPLLAQGLGAELFAGKTQPHKEQTGVVVVVLGGLFDVAAAVGQKTGNTVYQTQLIRAGKRQDVSVIHGKRKMACRRAPRCAAPGHSGQLSGADTLRPKHPVSTRIMYQAAHKKIFAIGAVQGHSESVPQR